MFGIINAVDAQLAWMPPLARIIIWATFSAALSMALYAKLSPQKKLAVLKPGHKKVRADLMRYDGEFAGMWSLIAKDLGMSFRQIGLVFVPFLLSVAPVVWLMFGLFELYGGTPDAPLYYTDFGPQWARGFEFWYILALLIVSIVIKIRFKII